MCILCEAIGAVPERRRGLPAAYGRSSASAASAASAYIGLSERCSKEDVVKLWTIYARIKSYFFHNLQLLIAYDDCAVNYGIRFVSDKIYKFNINALESCQRAVRARRAPYK